MAKNLLIIEDEALLGAELKRHFQREGWRVTVADTLSAARQEIFDRGLSPPVVLSDMNLPDGNALDLLEEVGSQQPGAEWIFLTGYGSVSDSVRALRLGAFDFLEKPIDIDRLEMVVSGAARSATAQRRVHDHAAAGKDRFTPASFVGRSAVAGQLRDMLMRLAEAPFTALIITGETGTGKGVAARILHHSGPRRDAPLVEVNCSALPKDLLESELFGHEAGAFTGARGRRRGLFEQADGGTLFLDEIGEMPVDLQAKLLKVLEEQSFRRVGGDREIIVDVQLIAATNRDLAARVAEGAFREDLYHRLGVFELPLPPLRERLEDLDDLVPLFIAEFNAKSGRHVSTTGAAAWEKLRTHSWPGNVRELRNVIERCVLFADGTELPAQWMQLKPDRPAARANGEPPANTNEAVSSPLNSKQLCIPLDGSMSLDDMDRCIISAALEHNRRNIAATARALKTTRDTLRYRIRKYAIDFSEDA
ncbi:MAG: sigma-54 dependent transcriptional regulator [Thiogranum sp.]|nr:sigma-54 dependent transcriptional regulator [Thiogranum sp.]